MPSKNRKHVNSRRHAKMQKASIAALSLLISGGCVAPAATQALTEGPLRWVAKIPLLGQLRADETDPASPPSIAASPPRAQLAAHRTQSADEPLALGDDLIEALPTPMDISESEISNSEISMPSSDPQVIDLASSLGMAGANAWTIQLARQRTLEAHADLTAAKALWLPSLQMGIGWNNHGGRIQATDGQVIEAARSSLFFGGGATFGSAPVAGGSGGPLRLSADLALADAFFGQKIAGRNLAARRYGVSVAQNQAVVRAGLAYIDLLEAAAMQADAQAAIDAASELLQLTQTFQQAGAGAQADVDRAATEQARLQQQLQDAERRRRTASASLARNLRLDPRTFLSPADPTMMPLELSADVEISIR